MVKIDERSVIVSHQKGNFLSFGACCFDRPINIELAKSIASRRAMSALIDKKRGLPSISNLSLVINLNKEKRDEQLLNNSIKVQYIPDESWVLYC